jgi:hypothetical protein
MPDRITWAVITGVDTATEIKTIRPIKKAAFEIVERVSKRLLLSLTCVTPGVAPISPVMESAISGSTSTSR